MLSPVALPLQHECRPGASVLGGDGRMEGLRGATQGPHAGRPSAAELIAALDALELAAMSHAEAQRRDDPRHTEATRIELLKARAVAAGLVHVACSDPPGLREVINEAADCLDRNSATRLARRLRQAAR